MPLYNFTPRRLRGDRRGAALILALWSVILMTMLVMSLSFQMRLEAKLTGYYRQRLKCQSLARAGIEWAKFMIVKSESSFSDEEMYGEEFAQKLKQAKNSMTLSGVSKPGPEVGLVMDGDFKVEVMREQGRRNVNTLEREEWEELLENAGVPLDAHNELIDCFRDWVDEDDNNHLDGAEEGDSFYRDREYSVKNAPLDTIDELLLIKGWHESILFGGIWPDDEEIRIQGISRLLTTWGTGQLNVNSASSAVLRSLPGMDDERLANVLRARLRDPTDPEDDGFGSPAEFVAVAQLDPNSASRYTTTEKKHIRISSIGEYEGTRFGIWCILRQKSRRQYLPVLWREELLP